MGGVEGTRYLLPIHFCSIRAQKMSRLKMRKKVIKNNFRILKNPHANLQTIAKAPVKFQKDWPKTVGGVEGTRYLLKIRNHAPRTTESRKQCPSAFLRKGGGQKKKKKKKNVRNSRTCFADFNTACCWKFLISPCIRVCL